MESKRKNVATIIVIIIMLACIMGLGGYVIVLSRNCGSDRDIEPLLRIESKSCLAGTYLGNGVFTHVCNVDGRNVMDLRLFINESATIKGITLTMSQFMKLYDNIDAIKIGLRIDELY